MERKSTKKEQGFSLIELIIAIAILVILTGFLAPQFMRYIEKSRESVCRKNMDEMLNIYRMEFVDNIAYTVTDVIEAHKDRKPCPSGGEYENGTKRMGGIPWMFCKIHDEEILKIPEDLISSEKIYKDMVDFTGLTKEKISQITGVPVHQVRNDTLWNYLWEKNGNTWSVFDSRYMEKYPYLQGKYIQPYLNVGSNIAETTANDVVVFANSNNSKDSKNWHTDLIYDPDEKAWYKGSKGFSVANMSWTEIKEKMTEQSWQKLN